MLVLKQNSVVHLCLKHERNNTAKSYATVAMTDGLITIRDQVTMSYEDKQRTPRGKEFTVYLTPDIEVYCVHFADTQEIGYIMPNNVQAMRDGLMKRHCFAPPWTR